VAAAAVVLILGISFLSVVSRFHYARATRSD